MEANQEWTLDNNDDTEQPDMSQLLGSGLAQSTPITLENLTQTTYDLQQAVGQLAVTMADLAKQVNLAIGTCSHASKIVVSKPKAWNGKGNLVNVCHFLAAFNNYARNEGDALNDWDVALMDWIQNDQKWIAAVLNLMEDEVRTWALPHLEGLAAGLSPFSGPYNIFMDAFTKHFTLHDSTEVAQDALKHLKQGKNSNGGIHGQI